MKLLILALMVLVISSFVSAQLDAPWPMSMHDAQRTRQSQNLGSENYNLKWTFEGASGFLIIGQDGTIYAKNSTKLLAIFPNGSLKWSYNVNFYHPPSIGYDGTLYVPTPGGHYLYALNPNGSLKWTFYTSKSIDCSPAISSDGTIYIGTDDDVLYSLNPNGILKWAFYLGENGSAAKYPSLALDDTIYMSNFPNKFYAINPNGTLRWVKNFSAGIGIVGSNGQVYLSGSMLGCANTVYTINPNGTLRWVKNFSCQYTANYPHLLGVSKDGTVYVGDVWASQSKIMAIDLDGNFKWNYTTEGSIANTAISSDGAIYFVANYPYGIPYGIISAITSNGNLLWYINTSDAGLFDVVIGYDKTIYVSSSNKIYAIGPNTPQPNCTDNTRNGNETDIDCGGNCPKCADGRNCNINSDCQSGYCENGICKKPCSPSIFPELFTYSMGSNNNLYNALSLISKEFKTSNVNITYNLLATVMATLSKEVGGYSFLPVEEYGDYGMGRGCTYRINGKCRPVPYEGGVDYKGRGYIQITHKSNYQEHCGSDCIGTSTSQLDVCGCKHQAYCTVTNESLCPQVKALEPQRASNTFVSFYLNEYNPSLVTFANRGNFQTVGMRINGDLSYARDFSKKAKSFLNLFSTYPNRTSELISCLTS